MKYLNILIFLLALLAASPARAREREDRFIPRPDPATLLEQPPLPMLTKDLGDVNPGPPKKGIIGRIFDKKLLFLTAVDVGLSIAATKSLVSCRADHGIGACTDGGYGEFKTREGLRQGLTGFLALTSWELKWIEDQDGDKYKFWWLFQAGNAAVNAGVMIENGRKHFGPKDKT
jgi:hypothetical protein